MHYEYERVAEGGRLEFADCDKGRHGGILRVVVGSGRGCVMYGHAAAATVLVPLKGRVQLSGGESTRTFVPGQLLTAEGGQRLQLIGRGPALWIAVLASARAWRRLSGAETAAPLPDPVLLPALHAADHVIRRGAIALSRAACDGHRDGPAIHAVAASFATGIADLQSEFDGLIERCAGRTLAQRRGVFLRLHRVRNLMVTSCHLELDLADCARMASYSPCHFIRAFSAVYGETPHAVLVEQRLRRAHRLLNTSVLAISEVAHISGFEDRCSFSRSFKRRFGITATDLRDELHASLRAVA